MKKPIILFFFFNPEIEYKKVNIKVSFSAPKGKNPSIEELHSFLAAVSNLHEYAILSTQPEYMDDKRPVQLNSKVLDHHKLEVKHICRKNPFDIELTFYIVKEGLITYWPFIQAFFFVCNRYGKSINNLKETLSYIKEIFNQLYQKFYINNSLSRLTLALSIFEDQTKLFEKLSSNFMRLMSDRKFREYYDFFCSTSIIIKSVVSEVEDFGEILDLYKEEE
jgi:hypothetical protein